MAWGEFCFGGACGMYIVFHSKCWVSVVAFRGEFIRDGVQGEWGLYLKLGIKCWAAVLWH